MDDRFFAALFPCRHRILGFRLRPYSFGHLAALMAVGSPLVAEAGPAAEAGAGDLLLALRVCRLPAYPLLASEDLRPRFVLDGLLRWWLERRPARLKRYVQAFVCYRDDHSSFPEFYRQEAIDAEAPPSGRTLSAPALLARVCTLISRTSITLEQAWSMPLALPSWMIGTLDELDGAPVRFSSEHDEDDLPPEEELSEEELYQRAVVHLGQVAADAWRAARQTRHDQEKCQQPGQEGTRDGA